MATSFGHESEFAGLFASWNRQKDKSCLMPNLNFFRSEWVTVEGMIPKSSWRARFWERLGSCSYAPKVLDAVAGTLRWVEG